MRKPIGMSEFLVWVFVAIVVAQNAHAQNNFQSVTTIEVASYELIASRRIGRFDFQYEYSVSLTNNGNTLLGVTADIQSENPSISVSTDRIELLTVAAGETVFVPISLIHSRRTRFQRQDLVWSFSSIAINNDNSIYVSPTGAFGFGYPTDREVSPELSRGSAPEFPLLFSVLLKRNADDLEGITVNEFDVPLSQALALLSTDVDVAGLSQVSVNGRPWTLLTFIDPEFMRISPAALTENDGRTYQIISSNPDGLSTLQQIYSTFALQGAAQ